MRALLSESLIPIGCVLPKVGGRIPVALCEFKKIRKIIHPSRLPRGYTAGWNERLEPMRCVKVFPSMAAFQRWRKRQKMRIAFNDCWADKIQHLLPPE